MSCIVVETNDKKVKEYISDYENVTKWKPKDSCVLVDKVIRFSVKKNNDIKVETDDSTIVFPESSEVLSAGFKS